MDAGFHRERSNSKGTMERPQSSYEEHSRESLVGAASTFGGGATKRSLRVYLDIARRKSVRVPRDGAFVQIKNVFDIYKQVRALVGTIRNVWSWSCASTTVFRQMLPGLVRVHVGEQVFTVPGYLLLELDPITEPMRHCASTSSLSQLTCSGPSVQDVRIKRSSRYFPSILLFLKLRWLLRLHSACCELDYKVCSLKSLILGLQYVILQQHAEAECDSGFDAKVDQHVGSHLNLESVLDDIMDQLQRSLGVSWKVFLEFVSSCDPTRSLHRSKMDSRITVPKIVSNDQLALVTDTIFIANFLRRPRTTQASQLRDLFTEMATLGLPMPELPPLRSAHHLKTWAKARSAPTLHDRTRASKRDAEKLAQLDAVLLAVAVEMHSPEVIATAEELEEATEAALSKEGALPFQEEAPTKKDFSTAGKAPGSAGPPAAKVMLEDKPQLSPAIFETTLACIHHHHTFPHGIRERLYAVLNEEYGLSKDQVQRLAVAATQNIDGKKLSDSVVWHMREKEKCRLRQHQVNTGFDTSHLLLSPLVQAPIEKGKTAKYTEPLPVPERLPFSSAFSSVDMTRSLPDFRGWGCHDDGREPFKVPLLTGPLTMDHDLKKLRTTGLFMRMPPLKGGDER